MDNGHMCPHTILQISSYIDSGDVNNNVRCPGHLGKIDPSGLNTNSAWTSKNIQPVLIFHNFFDDAYIDVLQECRFTCWNWVNVLRWSWKINATTGATESHILAPHYQLKVVSIQAHRKTP